MIQAVSAAGPSYLAPYQCTFSCSKVWGAFKKALQNIMELPFRLYYAIQRRITLFKEDSSYEIYTKEAQHVRVDQLARGFLFEVKDAQNRSRGYLFGTVHTVPRELLHWHPFILQKFKEMKRLAVERDWTAYGEQNAVAKASLKGQNEFFAAPNLDVQALAQACIEVKNACLNARLVTQAEVDAMDALIERDPLLKARKQMDFYRSKLDSYSTGVALDQRLLAKAVRHCKEIIDLEEPINNHRARFIGTKMGYREWMGKTAAEIERDYREVKTFFQEGVLDNWRRGDFEAFERGYEDYEQTWRNRIRDPEMLVLDQLDRENINERNRQIAEGILKNSSTFSMVGCAHLTGRMGVISYLRQRGFSVTPVFAPQPIPLQNAQ